MNDPTRNYRTLARKESPMFLQSPQLVSYESAGQISTLNVTDSGKAASSIALNSSNIPGLSLRRRSSAGVDNHKNDNHKNVPNLTASQRSIESNLLLLNSVKINFPISEIPEDILRFIPDNQLKIMEPFRKNNQIIDPADQKFIVKKKYSTNVDERNYLTVYEYQINDGWIIWDYHTGYVFFTGLWKSCGNNKTDINKLIENFPNISSTVKRVRGGFLRIQGTWLPFHIVKDLAKKFCFNIRYCLVPLFGRDFPGECLKPGDPNFGKLVDVNTVGHRRRKSSVSSSSRFLDIPTSSSLSSITKPKIFKKIRSKSDSAFPGLNLPIMEMEEILKASKQLHDLSSSHNYSLHNQQFNTVKRDSFNYGGFVWSWNERYDLKILGRDNDSAITDDPNADQFSPQQHFPKLAPLRNITPDRHNVKHLLTPIEFNDISRDSVPKKYDGFESLLNAAQHLMNTTHDSTPSSVSSDTHEIRNKINIGELLS